jgi:UrcA family protein
MSSHIASSARATRTVVAALLTTSVSAIPASYAQSAEPDGDPPSEVVNFSDLNLATTEGSRALYQRLVDAAGRVCPTTSSLMEIRDNYRRQNCINTAVENAVKDVKNPRFAEVAASHMR